MERSSIVRRIRVSLWTFVLAAGMGCGSAAPGSQDVGVATVALSEAPPDVSCLEIAAVGTRQVLKRFAVTSGTTPVFEIAGLPLGSVQFTALAFAEACASHTQGAAPTWISDPVDTTIVKHVVAEVTVVMRRNGRVSVGIDFRDCIAGFVDLGTLDGTATINPVDMNNHGQIVGTTATEPFLWANGVMRALGSGIDTGVCAINDKGQVAGWNQTGTFLWQDGVTYEMGTLGGEGSMPNAMNDGGQVVGYGATVERETHAFLWQPGSGPVDLGTLGGPFSVAYAINASGQVVGQSETSAPETHAFLWQSGTMRDLGTLGGSWSTATAINDGGQVIGSSLTPSGEQHAFLWEAGTMRDLGTLGGDGSDASAINAKGQVVGHSNLTAGGTSHVFLWDGGQIRDLGTLGGLVSSLVGPHPMNNDGEIVGQAETTLGELHGFLWQAGVLHDLGTLGVPNTAAVGINAAHQIFGFTTTSSGQQRGFFFDVSTCSLSATLGGGQ